MCLIIHKQNNVEFSRADILDFYTYNQDGIGLMYTDKNVLQIYKIVPNSVEDVYKAFKLVNKKEAIIHLRMCTHGDIDDNNTHPYQVLSQSEHGTDLYLVHNGILSNVANDTPTMSDTWHYIRDTLKPILSQCPELIYSVPFQNLIGNAIGSSNKLVFMDSKGKTIIINKNSGTMYKKCWLSNTYAWSSPIYKSYTAPKTMNTTTTTTKYYDYNDSFFLQYNSKKDILDMSYTELYDYAETDLYNFIEDVYSLTCTI